MAKVEKHRFDVHTLPSVGVPPQTQNIFWDIWYPAHRNDLLWTVSFLFIKRSFRVKDLRWLFEWFFGEKP